MNDDDYNQLGEGLHQRSAKMAEVYTEVDMDYPVYLKNRPPPVRRGGWIITPGHCMAFIIIVLLAIIATIALLAMIEISEHRKGYEMITETMGGLHTLIVEGGGMASDIHKAWKAANGTELLKRLLALDEYADDGSAVPYDEEYERDRANKPPHHHKHSKDDMATGIHNALGLVGDLRRSKFFYQWSMIGYHFNKILAKPEADRAVQTLLVRSSDVMDELDPVDVARIIGGMDVGPELKEALLAFARMVIKVFGLSDEHHHHKHHQTGEGGDAKDRETKEGGEAKGKKPKEVVITRVMNSLDTIAMVASTPQVKRLLETLSKLHLQALIDQSQRSLNVSTTTVVEFNRRHMMERADDMMAKSEEILGDVEKMVGDIGQGVSITLKPSKPKSKPKPKPKQLTAGARKRSRVKHT